LGQDVRVMAVEVKICGLTNLADAEVACEAGADYLGFVLYPSSPRAISVEALERIASALAGRARLVGVFVNESPAVVRRVVQACGLYAAQLHGNEEAALFAGEWSFPLWRAVTLRDDGACPSPTLWPMVARYVVDAAAPGLYGGSGHKADWTAARAFARQRPTMLAGGLTADNVAEAVRRAAPLGVDVASGVEAAPGRKDHAAMRRFVAAARCVVAVEKNDDESTA
jgi:phosphoribosylanthranilate isomerase